MPQHASKAPKVGLETLEAFYSATMDALQEAKNDVSLLPVLRIYDDVLMVWV